MTNVQPTVGIVWCPSLSRHCHEARLVPTELEAHALRPRKPLTRCGPTSRSCGSSAKAGCDHDLTHHAERYFANVAHIGLRLRSTSSGSGRKGRPSLRL